jgi:coproporphyrinogen III oxidase
VRFFVAKAPISSEAEIASLNLQASQGGKGENVQTAQQVRQAPDNDTYNGAAAKSAEDIWWFGGGMDLTPYYGFEEDCIHFHRTNKTALDAFSPDFYPKFKQHCDEYFHLKHRKEPRGIGGIFFDDFNVLGFERSFEMQRAHGDRFLNAYLPLLQRR